MNSAGGMATAQQGAMTMRLPLVVLVTLAACNSCPPDRRAQTGFADMAIHRPEIAACVAQNDCARLCTELFALDTDAEVVRCKIIGLVLADSTVAPGPIAPDTDMSSALGVNVSVGYVEANRCGAVHGDGGGVVVADGWDDVWGDDFSDGGWCLDGWCGDEGDDGRYDDGSYDDDGGCDDGSCDDGDDGTDDDGGWDDGSDDDGGWGGDDGGGDDGGGDDGGGGDGGGGHGGGDFAPRPPHG